MFLTNYLELIFQYYKDLGFLLCGVLSLLDLVLEEYNPGVDNCFISESKD